MTLGQMRRARVLIVSPISIRRSHVKVGQLVACVALALSVGCKDDPTTPGTGNGAGNVMSATVDGLAVSPTLVTAVRSGNRIHIVGTGAFRTVTLSVVVPATTGELLLFPNDAINAALIAEGTPPNNPVWSTTNVPRDTSAVQYSIVTFTSLSTTGAAGSFSIKAGPATSNATGVRFGNGTFNVKF